MKIRFRRLKYVFIGTLFLSGCLFSPQKHTEIALSDAFQSILDQLYLILPQGQESYSGSVSFEVVTAKKHLQGILSGQWIFSGNQVEGNNTLQYTQTSTLIGNSFTLTTMFLFRLFPQAWYINLQNFSQDHGLGNIEEKFLQQILSGLQTEWVQIVTQQSLSIPYFPILSGNPPQDHNYMQMIIENYFPERKISTGTTLFSPHKGRIFEDYHFVSSNDKRQLQFSGQFDGKIFQGNMLAVGEKPLIWKLTTEKNQILIIGNWGNIEYTIQIDVGEHSNFRIQGAYWKNTTPEEKTSFMMNLSRIEGTLPLQGIPNKYIPLDRYLDQKINTF